MSDIIAMAKKQNVAQAMSDIIAKKQNVAQAVSDIIAGSDAEQERAITESETTTAGTDGETKPEGAMHSNLAASAFKFKKTKLIALPLFRMIANKQIFVLVDAPMYLGKKVDPKKEAATLMRVTDLETGEEGQIIIGKVLHDLIGENYPDDSYVGKKFAIVMRQRADKKYNTYDLSEIETDE